MVLLSAEKGMKAEEIAEITRESYITVLRWLKRYIAEGVEGLKDSDPTRTKHYGDGRIPREIDRSCSEATA